MKEKLTVSCEGKPCYDILLTIGFEELAGAALSVSAPERKICIVTDTNVAPLYAAQVKEAFSSAFAQVEVFEFPAGEENKTLANIQTLYAFLIEHHFDRRDMLAALGGGVVGDMTGFAAATYLRGIDFIQIPTTLLAQVDSSIGGKTGVDFDSYKNMVGAFHMPKLVYMNLDTLQTLDARQYYSGFAEIMKHGLIKDAKYYEWLISNMYEICERDPETLLSMIKRSCDQKRGRGKRSDRTGRTRALKLRTHDRSCNREKQRLSDAAWRMRRPRLRCCCLYFLEKRAHRDGRILRDPRHVRSLQPSDFCR